MTFDTPLLLVLAPVVAVGVGFLSVLARRRRIARAAAWSPVLAAASQAGGRSGPLLLALAGLSAAVAVAGPRGGRQTVTTETQALSVVLAMDISRSMLAEDTKPSRLGRAVREARRLVQDMGQDRVGLVAFAGRSYILSPLTLDGAAVTLFLDALSPDIASQGGTGLAAALNQGAELLNASREAGDRVLVVFTDGEALDSLPDVLAAARRLREEQVRVVLVAEGTPTPVQIPLRDSAGTVVEYKVDESGAPVETWRRDDVLQQVADAAEAALVPAELPDQAAAVRDLLAAFQRAPLTSSSTEDLVPLVWIPALIGAVLLAIQTTTRKSAALVGLALVALAWPARAQRPAPGVRDFQAGRSREAARALVGTLGASATDTAWYNAGTALLAAGQPVEARKALEKAAQTVDPDLRYRALYNMGVAALREAQADSTHRDSLFGVAAERLQEALRLVPSSQRAKWNLELAQSRRPPPSGGGGSTPKNPPPEGNKPPDPSPSRPEPPEGIPNLSQAQAEQILNSVSREERDTRSRRIGRARSAPAAVKDW